jgi:diguanylate cyclase (GGDEF)-like protein
VLKTRVLIITAPRDKIAGQSQQNLKKQRGGPMADKLPGLPNGNHMMHDGGLRQGTNGAAGETKSKKEKLAPVRVLGVVPNLLALSAMAQRVRETLGEGYEIVWATPQDVQNEKVGIIPDVVLVDATIEDSAALYGQFKSGVSDGGIPIVALVETQTGSVLLGEAGADDFLDAEASDVEIKARFAVAARVARLRHELQATRERLSHQLQVDDLTGALNRRFFFQSAYRECSRARRYGYALSCLMVDIDHFHLYNTTFGYACGDAILREVAGILKTCVRDTDLVARFGGSKFVVLLTHTDTDGAGIVRQKVEKFVADNYFVWQHQRLPVTVSIGEAERVPGRSRVLADDENEEDLAPLSTREDLAELLEDADSALFVAKKGARFPSFLEGPSTKG